MAAMSKEEKKERRRQRRLEKKKQEEEVAEQYASDTSGGNGGGNGNTALPKDKNDRLKSSDRNKFEKMIERRGELLQQSLLNEMSLDSSSIKELVKKRHGIVRTSPQIKYEIKRLKNQMEDACREEIAKRDSVLAIEMEELSEEQSEALTRLEQEYKANKDKLKESFASKQNEIQNKREELREEITKEKCPDLIKQIEALKVEANNISHTSSQIDMEARTERTIRLKQKDKLLGIVRDTIARSTEQVWSSESRSEAIEILNSIPTVSEIVMMFREETSDAMRKLFDRLMSIQSKSVGQLQLAAPEELFAQQFNNESIEAEVRNQYEDETTEDEDDMEDD